MEAAVVVGKVWQIDIYNFENLDAVQYLYNQVSVEPTIMHNSFHRKTGHNVEARFFAKTMALNTNREFVSQMERKPNFYLYFCVSHYLFSQLI